MISVVIPTYNREKTIKRAIDSILNQTYKDIEIIIVDDCSKDNTEEIIKQYKDNRIKYIKLDKNSGACAARNKGIELAKGQYIAFQDSDDYWKSDKLEKQLENMKKEKSDIDFCEINVKGESQKNKTIIKPTKKDLRRIKKIGVKKALCYQNFISTQAVIAKRECFCESKFDITLPRLQDYDMFFRLSSKNKISITQEPLVDLYVQDDSISKNPQKLINALNIMYKKDYSINISEEKIFKASVNRILGDCYKKEDKKRAKEYYSKALKYKFDFKVMVKKILL